MKRWFLGTILSTIVIACYTLAGLSFYWVGSSTGWDAVLGAFIGVVMLGMGCVGGWAIGPADEAKAVDDAVLAGRKP